MNIKFFCSLIYSWFFISGQIFAQSNVVSGFIYDRAGESLDQVIVTTKPATTYYTTSNAYGFYSLLLPAGVDSIVYQYLGYKTFVVSLAETTQPFNVYLEPYSFKEVVVHAPVYNSDFNRNTLDIPRMKTLPFLMGEADPMKAFLRFPGVQGGLEGSSSLHVRGGSADQNLLILDDAVVYNANHIFGFLSIFNSHVIKSADLYKGGFHAKYGGRLSSVIDIRLREGSRDSTRQKIGIGLIASDYVREGPLFNKRGSYLFSIRGASLFPATLVQRLSFNTGNTTDLVTFGMYDGNLKLNYDVNKKDKIYFSMYFSDDVTLGRYRSGTGSLDEDKSRLGWKNFSLSTRYSHQLGKKTFMNAILYKTDYVFNLEAEAVDGRDGKLFRNHFIQQNKIIDAGAKLHFTAHVTPFYSIHYGAEQSNYRNIPASQTAKSIEDGNEQLLFQRSTFSSAAGVAAYFHNTLTTGKFTWEGGLRGSLFRSHYSKTNFHALEPRLALSYQPNKHIEFSISYDKMFQPVQSLNSTGSGMPYETWVLSDKEIQPSISHNYAAGMRWRWWNGNAKSQISGYYRRFKELHELTGQGFFILPANIRYDEIVASHGSGRSWGVELSNEYSWKGGRAEINYTYSKSWRWFDEIDAGQIFPYKFDRRHVLLASMDISLYRNWKLNITGEFQSGPPIDLPISRSIDEYGDISYIYGRKHAYRLPIYHRLDISFFHSKTDRKNKTHEWNLGVYNVLSRKNPYFLRVNTHYLGDGQQYIGEEPFVQQVNLFRFLPFAKYTRIF